jgi:hypothetical protein
MGITTPAIQAKHVLQKAQTEDYVEWAMTMLEAELESNNLKILAGLSKLASPFEAEYYFKRAKLELGIFEPTKEQAIKDYAIYIAQQIIDEIIPYRRGVEILDQLCCTNDYPNYLMEWYYLDNWLDDIDNGESYDPEFDGKSPKEIVNQVACAFINNNTEQLDYGDRGRA